MQHYYVRRSHIFLTKVIFPDKTAVQHYYVRGSHIFLTKADRAGVQLYYVRGSHIFLTKAIFPDTPSVCGYMWLYLINMRVYVFLIKTISS